MAERRSLQENGPKLDDQQLRISIGLRLGANICVAHTCHCGKRVEQEFCTVFLAPRVLVASHVMLPSILSQSGRCDFSTCLQCWNRMDCTELMANRPDGVTMIPWEISKQLVWDVTVVDALASGRLNQGSLCNPGTTATEPETRKFEKYCELIDNR